MHVDPIQALQAGQRPAAAPAGSRAEVLVAGATGVLGAEVLQRLLAARAFGTVRVLAREPIRAGLRGVASQLVPSDTPQDWPALAGADRTGIVLFEPPRLFNDRERALWAPQPLQLPALARWMRGSGVATLAVVLPHDQGRLPQALQRGLASLDEHAVAALGFERLIVIRSARKPPEARLAALPALARWMLSITRYMVPGSEQPVRAAKVAELLAVALATAPPGIHIAAPETVWRAAQGELQAVARQWLIA
ncbi:hypothetical protein [Ramlibacter tataouinensis]|uniref:NAD(P)-binding domain-containing protein n=1 Tax=Ramlibacter tataouinensis (strain ATCC BAA-407 / DSM 14655 / LMG 21543 / TTB310) TaxID=365046 RepID=F5Y5D7_RAMTT|nr:hypothetical protein [Ramlibacter tataouinensis]AEG91447.1 Conserved hypothetical protein [Ramlibacter tataouinensis TTB310]